MNIEKNEQYIFDGYLSKVANAEYRIQIAAPIERCSHVRFTDIMIPYTWYNIDERWNKFSFQEEGKEPTEIVFTAKNYDVATFLADMQSKMRTASPNNITYDVVLDLGTGYLVIKDHAETAKFMIVYGPDYDFLNGMLGYWQSNPSFLVSQKGNYAFSLRPIKSIFIKTSIIRSQTVGQNDGNILYAINLQDEVYGDIVGIERGLTFPWIETTQHRIDNITFQITDDSGRYLELHGNEIKGTISFRHF